MSRPKSDFDAQREDVRKVYDGDPWHGSSISDVLNGVDAGTGLTVGTLIRGLLQHHTYHEGQIALLKRAAEAAKSGKRPA
jgi:hypothetical protein